MSQEMLAVCILVYVAVSLFTLGFLANRMGDKRPVMVVVMAVTWPLWWFFFSVVMFFVLGFALSEKLK